MRRTKSSLPGRLAMLAGLVTLAAGCKSGADYAKQLRSTTDPVDRQEAILYFSHKDRVDKRIVEILRGSVTGGEKSELVRAASAYALGEIGDRANADVLIKALEDKSWLVRFDAVVALGKLADPRGVRPLVERLSKDPHAWVRLKAARSLAQLKSRDSVPALVEALGDKDHSVRFSAHQALVTITGQKLSRQRSEWEGWLSKQGLGKPQ